MKKPENQRGLAGAENGGEASRQQRVMAEVKGLCKTYRAEVVEPIRACDNVDFEVCRGEIVAVCGPSGSGKSTLLHLIGALDSPDDGVIVVAGTRITELKGRRLAEYRRGVGFVFQRFHLLPTLTATDNVIAPLVDIQVLSVTD